MPTRVPLVLGTMTFATDKDARISNPAQVQRIVDTFKSHGQTQIDTARVYGSGTTEALLGQLDLSGVTIDSKCHPRQPGGHQPAKLRETLHTILEKLQKPKLRIYYLHAPDRSTPFEETCREMNSLHQEGLFDEFGLSNFRAWEVALIWSLCDKNGWIKPTVYQGMYNAITRDAEGELIPCLRKLGLRFLAYNPLAGGMLAKRPDAEQTPESGGRFDKNTHYGAMYLDRYWKPSLFNALKRVSTELRDIKPSAAALRWIQHHSLLTEQDGVIIGGSSLVQIEANCSDSEGGPLPDNVVKALDEACYNFKADCPTYWR